MGPLHAGWKEPQWDDSPVTIPRRVLQQCEQALSESRGLIQRLESHSQLDARDQRALSWGRRAIKSVREALK